MSQIEKISRALTPQPAPIAPEPGDDWLDVQAFFRVIRRRIGLIALIAAVIVLLSLPMILGMERAFSASTRILIREPLPATLSSGLLSDTKLNLTTEGERLLSRDVAVRVIQELGLQDLPEFNPALRQASPMERLSATLRETLLRRAPPVGPDADPMPHVLPEYLGRLTIWRNPNSEVVNIGFASRDAELAAMVPNTLVRIYLEERARHFAARTATAEGWLNGRITEQQARLAAAVAALDAAKQESEIRLRSASGNAEAVADLEAARAGISRARADLAARIAALREADGPEARADAADTEVLAGMRRDLETERRNLARLLDRYGTAHEEVIAIREKVSDLEGRMEDEVTREERRLQTRLLALRQEDAGAAQSLKDARAALAESRRTEVQFAQLQHAVDSERDDLDGLENQLRALKAEALLPATEIEVLSPATVPLNADGRGRAYYLAVAIFAAGTLALTAAFFVEMIDRAVRSHEQLKAIPSVRAAGMVPALTGHAIRQFWKAPGAGVLGRVYSDAIQGVALGLEMAGNGALPQSLLITSALPGEGRTTFAAALAAELAASGRRVLLVDADLHGGGLSERFGRTEGPGFGDYLSGRIDLGQIPQHEVARDIALIPRGSAGAVHNVDRTLVRALIRSANANRQIVILDGPPALVAHQAALLAGAAARTLLFIHWGKTDLRSVEAAVTRLAAPSDEVIDVVIGRVNLRRQAFYGYRDAGVLARTIRQYHTRVN